MTFYNIKCCMENGKIILRGSNRREWTREMHRIGIVCNQQNKINRTTESSKVREVCLGCATCWGLGSTLRNNPVPCFSFYLWWQNLFMLMKLCMPWIFQNWHFQPNQSLWILLVILWEILNVQNVWKACFN